ncbi:MAG: four helix bundle protein [Candidatus Marinimicrobia bacterium]|nr:four helix bundle protein [Candidatus Neomarinimicrobiota bacterium]
MASFKELEVFQLSVQYVKSIYQTTNSFPKEERYGLTSQLRDAAVTISSCIAEGSGRRTAADRKHYIDIAISSLFETHSQLIIASELSYINKAKLAQAEEFIEKLKAKLIAYHKSIKDRP